MQNLNPSAIPTKPVKIQELKDITIQDILKLRDGYRIKDSRFSDRQLYRSSNKNLSKLLSDIELITNGFLFRDQKLTVKQLKQTGLKYNNFYKENQVILDLQKKGTIDQLQQKMTEMQTKYKNRYNQIYVDILFKKTIKRVKLDTYLNAYNNGYQDVGEVSGKIFGGSVQGVSSMGYIPSGGCGNNTKHNEQFQNEFYKFNCTNPKSKDNDCIFACIQYYFKTILKDKEFKCVYNKTIRKNLKIEQGITVSLDFIQQIAQYFKCQITIYNTADEQPLIFCDNFNNNCKILLVKNHYYYIDQLLNMNQQKLLDKKNYINQQVKTDDNKFELLKEQDFKDFNQIVDYIILNKEKNVFIEGPAGVGKTYLAQLIQQKYKQLSMNIQIFGTTGQASKNISYEGQTIHLGLRKLGENSFENDILIDEVSMLDGEIMNNIIQRIDNNRMILIGDFYQLPAVNFQDSGFMFQSSQYESIHTNMIQIQLNINKRQKDDIKLFNLLQNFRNREFNKEDLELLYKIQQKELPNEYCIITHSNKTVDEYNQKEIDKLIEQKVEQLKTKVIYKLDEQVLQTVFPKNKDKQNKYINMIKNRLNKKQNKEQIFYINERVIYKKNDLRDFNIYNGSIGTILEFKYDKNSKQDCIVIKFDNIQNPIEIYKSTQRTRKDLEIFRSKFELQPAYALTIHKSQGMTIKHNYLIDCKHIFASYLVDTTNQLLYVALSRSINFNNIYLTNFKSYSDQQIIERINYKGPLFAIINEYLQCQVYEDINIQMVIEDNKKQLQITKKNDIQLVGLNNIFMDFETGLKEFDQFTAHKPYYNKIIHVKNNKQQKPLILNAIDGISNETKDVAQLTYKYIMSIVDEYIKYYQDVKKLNQRSLIRQAKLELPRIITFNGSGFDLHFLVKQLCQDSRFIVQKKISNVYKGSSLVVFTLYDTNLNIPVLTSFDLYQLCNCSLKQACQSFLPNDKRKLDFKDEIIYIANNIYKNPQIMKDEIQTIKVDKIVEFINQNDYQIQDQNDYTLTDQSKIRLDVIQKTYKDLQYRKFNIECYKEINLYQQLIKYGDNDTDVMIPLLEAMNEVYKPILKCDIMNFYTLGSLTWYGWSQYIPKQLQHNRYDQNRNLKTRKHNGYIKTDVYKNELQEEQIINQCKYGGKSLPRQTLIDENKNQNYIYLDISGMYVKIMLNKRYKQPYGKKQWQNEPEKKELLQKLQQIKLVDNNEIIQKSKLFEDYILDLQDDLNIYGFHEVDIEGNQTECEPVVAFKQQVNNSKQFKTIHTNLRRIQNLCTLDIIMILAKGGKIHNILKSLVFDSAMNYTSEYIQKTLDLKNQGVAQNNSGIKKAGKDLGNSFYGQTLKQDRQQIQQLIQSQWEAEEFCNNYEIQEIFDMDNLDLLIGTKIINEKEYITSRISHLGVYVLAYSRLMIQNICIACNPNDLPQDQPIVGDTDSLLIREDIVNNQLIPQGFIKEENGFLTDELSDKKPWYIGKDNSDQEIKNINNYRFAKVYKGIFPAPKTLSLLYKDQEGNIKNKIRAKGININSTLEGSDQVLSCKLMFDLHLKSQEIRRQNEEYKQQNEDYNNKDLKDCGQLMKLPQSLQLITSNKIRTDDEAFELNYQGIKKNNKIYQIMQNDISRGLFCTEYTGRQKLQQDQTILVPFGFKQKLQN